MTEVSDAGASNGSGMCIPVSVRMTEDKGRGVFAEAAVPAGATVWRHLSGQFEVLDEAGLSRLLASGTREDAVDVLTHIVSMEEFPGFMVRYFDEGALINHGDTPNVIRKHSAGNYQGPTLTAVPDVSTALTSAHFDLVAASDLRAGDELLMDYNIEPDDPDYYEQACRDYGITWDWL